MLPSTLTFRRRAFFKLGAAAAATLFVGSHAAEAADALDVYATTPWDRAVGLRRKPIEAKKVAVTLDPGTSVRLIEGPDERGWYRVESIDGSTTGWIQGEHLSFVQGARLLWDAALFSAPTEWSEAVDWLRHGIIVVLLGPVSGGFVLVRYGDLWGHLAISGLEATDQPPTDAYGERWVDVNRSTSEVRLMIGDTDVDTFPASLSRDQGEGFYATATGGYVISSKTAGLSYTKYANAYIEYWAGFDTERDNGFHSWTMDATGNVIEGGWGYTGGCVATEPATAAIIFDFVELGTRVDIHW